MLACIQKTDKKWNNIFFERWIFYYMYTSKYDFTYLIFRYRVIGL